MTWFSKFRTPKQRFNERWPDLDVRNKTIREVETCYGISEADEVDDEFDHDLGHHPSKTYYGQPEPDLDAVRIELDQRLKKFAR